jgi:MarR family transcriptional regulator, organic hydroperoxide resistance regulator
MDERQGTATALGSEAAPDAGLGLRAEPVRDAGPVLDAEAVPHAAPLEAGPLYAAGTGPGAGDDENSDDELNQQIVEALSELIKRAHGLSQGIGSDFGLTSSDAMALLKLEEPLTMKELGLRMGCDPSFVTSIADALEKHGLARREPSQHDRRSKNIVLTPEGVRVRDLIVREISARAPWCTTLDTSERRCLLTLIRKMLTFRAGR